MKMARVTACVLIGGVLATAVGCGSNGSSSSGSTTAKLPSPQELTAAQGKVAGTCLAVTSFGAPLNYSQKAKIRDSLHVLIDAAAIDPKAPTADKNYTVSDALFDSVEPMKGCDAGLEQELKHAIDSLP